MVPSQSRRRSCPQRERRRHERREVFDVVVPPSMLAMSARDLDLLDDLIPPLRYSIAEVATSTGKEIMMVCNVSVGRVGFSQAQRWATNP